MKVVEEFNKALYSSNDRQTKDSSMETMDIEVPYVSASEIKKSLKRWSRGTA